MRGSAARDRGGRTGERAVSGGAGGAARLSVTAFEPRRLVAFTPADSVRDQRIERIEPLVAPNQLLEELPLSDEQAQVVLSGRAQVHAVLDREDDRLLVVVGPCSV